MGAFFGYNQIFMHFGDHKKTSFIIEHDTYCYKVMPFNLKNADATYQMLVNKIFKDEIGKLVKVYVDDILVKCPNTEAHIEDLKRAFQMFRKYKMKLNPKNAPLWGRQGSS